MKCKGEEEEEEKIINCQHYDSVKRHFNGKTPKLHHNLLHVCCQIWCIVCIYELVAHFFKWIASQRT